MSFGEKLKQLRKENGVTQKELGEAIGKSNRVISYYENEFPKDKKPDAEFLDEIILYFGIPSDYFDTSISKSINTKPRLKRKSIMTESEFEQIVRNLGFNIVSETEQYYIRDTKNNTIAVIGRHRRLSIDTIQSGFIVLADEKKNSVLDVILEFSSTRGIVDVQE